MIFNYTKEQTLKFISKILENIVKIILIFLMINSLFLLIKHNSFLNSKDPLSARLKFAFDYYFILSLIGFFSSIIYKFINLILDERKILDVSAKKFIKDYPEIIILAIAFIWTFLGLLTTYNKELSWNGNNYNHEGFKAVMAYSIMFYLAYTIKSEKFKEILIIAFLVPAFIVGFLCLLQFLFNVKMNFSIVNLAHNMVFNNSNHYGYFCVICTLISAGLLLYSKNNIYRIIYSMLFAIFTIDTFASKSEGAVFGVLFGLIFLIITFFLTGRKSGKKDKDSTINFILIAVIFILVFVILEIASKSEFLTNMAIRLKLVTKEDKTDEEISVMGSGRIGLWISALRVMKAYPLFGKGLDVYLPGQLDPEIFMKVDFIYFDMPHNEYLQIGSNVGILPMVCYLAVIFIMYIRALRTRKTLSSLQMILLTTAFGYCVSAFFGNTFIYTYPYFILIFAMAFPKTKQREKNLCSAEQFLTIDAYQEEQEAFKLVEFEKEISTIKDGWTSGLKIPTKEEIEQFKNINEDNIDGEVENDFKKDD